MKLKKFFAVGLALVSTAGLFAGCVKKRALQMNQKH